ncbi:MAG: DUF3224 domain-containing protein [Candidatus Promineifilaceae bacterium]|jgi:hypothetical protein
MKVSGKFDVQLLPLEPHTEGENGINLSRMSIDKTFHGGLEATSKGEMLSAMTPVEGSAGYVAMEQVGGTLEGRDGGFVLQHYGTIDHGQDYLLLGVVPGSGTGELVGISGNMSLRIEDGEHYYEFEYQLEE